jgi:hypothetical protein
MTCVICVLTHCFHKLVHVKTHISWSLRYMILDAEIFPV